MRCIICNKEFNPTHAKHICCSPECRHTRHLLVKKLDREAKRKVESGRCANCGKEVAARRKYCESPACQRARKAKNALTRTLRTAAIDKNINKRMCAICGEPYVQRHPAHVTCGREKCVKAQMRSRRSRGRIERLRRIEEMKTAEERRQAAEMSHEEIERIASSAPCYWRGFYNDKGHWVEPLQTQIPGLLWSDPIMGLPDYGLSVEWVTSYEYWRQAA